MTGDHLTGVPGRRRGRLPVWAWVLIAVALLVQLPMLITLLVGSVGFVASDTQTPTREDASTQVGRIVNAAVQRDFAKLCQLERTPHHCETALAGGARETAPTEPPRVELRMDRDDVGWLFVLTGRDGRGRPYESEVFVPVENDRGLVTINAVFWTGARVPTGELSY